MVEIALQSISEQLMYKYTMTINILVLEHLLQRILQYCKIILAEKDSIALCVCELVSQSYKTTHLSDYPDMHIKLHLHLYCMLAHILILRHGLSDALHDKCHK